MPYPYSPKEFITTFPPGSPMVGTYTTFLAIEDPSKRQSASEAFRRLDGAIWNPTTEALSASEKTLLENEFQAITGFAAVELLNLLSQTK